MAAEIKIWLVGSEVNGYQPFWAWRAVSFCPGSRRKLTLAPMSAVVAVTVSAGRLSG
jgi:hypothetical protein